MKENPITIYSIGHSTRSIEEFVELLTMWDVKILADVRSIPRSRTNPQFNKEILPKSLESQGIHYHHILKLGGRRGRRKDLLESPNTGWKQPPFQNYADYALTEDFQEGLAELLELTNTNTVAYMCSEAVWWRCHRRIITDYLLARGLDVRHIMSTTKADTASLTPFAVVESPDRVIYPGSEWLGL